MIELDLCRDASRTPVCNPLHPAVLLVAQQFTDFGGAAEVVNQFSVFGHFFHQELSSWLHLNMMFNAVSNILCNTFCLHTRTMSACTFK